MLPTATKLPMKSFFPQEQESFVFYLKLMKIFVTKNQKILPFRAPSKLSLTTKWLKIVYLIANSINFLKLYQTLKSNYY